MARRQFLQLLGGVALAGCGAPGSRGPSTAAVKAVGFDLFTVFDPREIDRRVAAFAGGVAPALAATWKAKLFDYCFIRAASGQYEDFERLVHDALVHAVRAHRVTLTEPQRRDLESAFVELRLWPDARATLEALRGRGLRLAPLANFSPRMIHALLAHAKLDDLFDARISTDRARTYKPDPRAYALAESTFGLPRAQIAFATFGGWDAAGAKWFGFPTFWVNRLGLAAEELVAADASGPDLCALASWIASPR
jgi:2-haloacid dehalogenase